MQKYYVYILASHKNGTLYVGVTGNIHNRLHVHQSEIVKGFTQTYGIHDLVYLEEHNSPDAAILREKQIKKWKRFWKINLIESINPDWKDFSEEINLI